jgi:gentisate 1,2-dioxygenase
MTAISASAKENLAEMERLNEEAAHLNIWMRTRANSPLQQPWHVTENVAPPTIAPNALPAGRRAVPFLWKWRDISHYLEKVAELCSIEQTDRQQLQLVNPGFGGELRIANSIRVAVSIYKPGDVAPIHQHSPNASRTILSDSGGYSLVEGERCTAERGDLIFTPNGTWHGHGNDDAQPVVWMDVLDWPLLDFLGLIWIREDFAEASVPQDVPAGFSRSFYGAGGISPSFEPFTRGAGTNTSPYFHYRGADILHALGTMREYPGDPHRGRAVEFVNPLTRENPFPTFAYGAQLLKGGESTRSFRQTASTVFCVLAGSGYTEVNGQRFEWGQNDVFVVPNSLWHHHVNASLTDDAVLYSVSDRPLIEKIGQYYAQGRTPNKTVIDLR